MEAANINRGNPAPRGVVFPDFAGERGGLIDDDEDRIGRLGPKKRGQPAQEKK